MKNIFKNNKLKHKIYKKYNPKNAIEVKNYNFKYSGAKKGTLQLKNINLDIEKGKWTTILGPNGSGKSTLAKGIIRINKARLGNIYIDGKHINAYHGKEFAKKVAYIPQQIEIPHGTVVYDFVSFGRNPYLGFTGALQKEDKRIIEKAMKETGSWQWKDKMVDELSGGQRQKVLIAMIIVQDAEIILLDEPTTYLDIRNQYELLEMMHNEHVKGKTIITILHDINQAVQYSDHIFILKDGELFCQGTPTEVINSNNIQAVYGVDAKFYKDKDRQYITDVKLVDFDFNNNHEHKLKSKVHTYTKSKK